MPIGFLTAAERDRLNHFPAQIPDEDLRAFFLLTEDDQRVINQQCEAHTRLGFALQLCAVRYLGFAPDDLHTTPREVVTYIARQLEVPPRPSRPMGGGGKRGGLTSGRSRGIWGFAWPLPWISMPCRRGWRNAP